MTLEQKRQEIRKKINEACPELLELGFGCEFCFNDEAESYEQGNTQVRDTIVKVYVLKSSKDEVFGFGVIGVSNEYDFESIEQIVILGKTPTLEHLLRTIPRDVDNIVTRGRYLLIPGKNGVDISIDLTKSVLKQIDLVTDGIYQLICE